MPGNESLLLGYIRFVHNGVLCKELAIALSLNIDTRGKALFQEVKTYFETNVIACATDGAPSMSLARFNLLLDTVVEFLQSCDPGLLLLL